jgi:hypothetical protein
MAAPPIIPNQSGLLPANVLTTIYYAQGTGVVSKIKNINFASDDTSPAFTLSFYISFDSGASDVLIWSKQLNGGDNTIDHGIYYLTDEMRLKALVDVDQKVSYTIVAELINNAV